MILGIFRSLPHRSVRVGVAMVLSVAFGAAAQATDSEKQSSFDDFVEGKMTDLMLSGNGILRLGPHLSKVTEVDASVIWTSAIDADGNLYLGTGNRGAVYRVSPEGEATLLFDPDEVMTRALAVSEDGVVFAGTSPKGRVYRIEEGQRPQIYFDPPDGYIWDLLLDDEGGLYVATGSQGRIYYLPADMEPGSEGEVWFETSRTHITSLAFDAKQHLLAGTAPQAYLYHIRGKDDSEVLYNAGTVELSQVYAAASGDIYFTTFSQQQRGAAQAQARAARANSRSGNNESSGDNSGNNESAQQAQQAPQRQASARRRAQTPPASALYRVDRNGFVEPVWHLDGVQIYSFQPTADGEWIIGTGKDGAMYQVHDGSSWSLLQHAGDGGEVSAIIEDVADGGGYYVLTSNPARVYRLKADAAESGEFVSTVVDAEQISRWGSLRVLAYDPVRADGLEWVTRTGNTPQPDDSWTDWKPGEAGRVGSPAARYLQYKMTFTDPTNGVREVQVFYDQRNAAPIVERVNVLPVGIELITVPPPQRSNADINQLIEGPRSREIRPPQPRRQFRIIGGEDHIAVGWKAEDPRGDRLLFRVEMQRLGSDEGWLLMADDLEEPAYSFNTRGFDDGYYEIKVTASDRLDNPEGEERTAYRISDPFLIDNTPPQLEWVETVGDAARKVVTFSASDEWSLISRAEFIHNGASAQHLVPRNGMFDSTEAVFDVVLRDLKPGHHTVILEVFDESGNSSVRSARFSIE